MWLLSLCIEGSSFWPLNLGSPETCLFFILTHCKGSQLSPCFNGIHILTQGSVYLTRLSPWVSASCIHLSWCLFRDITMSNSVPAVPPSLFFLQLQGILSSSQVQWGLGGVWGWGVDNPSPFLMPHMKLISKSHWLWNQVMSLPPTLPVPHDKPPPVLLAP